MSITLMAGARTLNMPSTLKQILKEYCDFANDDGIAWPSNETVCLVTGLSRRTVQRGVKQFTNLGIFEEIDPTEKNGRGKTTPYRINMDRAFEVYGIREGCERLLPGRYCKKKGAGAAPNSDEKGATVAPPGKKKGATQTRKGATDDTKGRQGGTQTIRNHQEPCAAAPANGERDADGAQCEHGNDQTLISRWSACQERVSRYFEPGTWLAWHGKLVPESDDGETLVLAAPSRFIADYFRQHYATKTGEIIHRKIEVHHRAWLDAKVANANKGTEIHA